MARGRVRRASGQGGDVAFSDISQTGCRFYDPYTKVGARLKAWIEDVGPFEGIVRWAENGDVGVEFDRPIYAPVFEHLRRRLGWDEATSARQAKTQR